MGAVDNLMYPGTTESSLFGSGRPSLTSSAGSGGHEVVKERVIVRAVRDVESDAHPS